MKTTCNITNVPEAGKGDLGSRADALIIMIHDVSRKLYLGAYPQDQPLPGLVNFPWSVTHS